MLIPAESLRAVITEIFVRAGCSGAEAGRIADNLVGANLRGHDSHGVIRTPRYVSWLEHGVQLADQDIEILSDAGTLLLVDGRYGMGQTVGPQACELGIDRAREHGHAIVGLRHAGHLGRIGLYAEMAAAAGQVSIHFVNVAGSQLVAPFGSRNRRMGTNPVAIGVPRAGAEPAILDFATSIVAEGKAMVALSGGPALPEGALVDGDGRPTSDPAALYHLEEGRQPDATRGPGALRAVGDHKGSGLSFMCELLAGALLDSGCAGPGQVRFCNGMLSIYLDPAAVAPDADVAANVNSYIEWFLDAEPAEGVEQVLSPGDPERARKEARERDGLDLPDDVWNGIVDAAATVGLSAGDIEALVG